MTDLDYWRDLETNAHLPEMQALIREEILSGAIRVRPRPGGGILIMPVSMPESGGPMAMDPPPAPIPGRDEPTQGRLLTLRARSSNRTGWVLMHERVRTAAQSSFPRESRDQ
jgi:hypothetical protein